MRKLRAGVLGLGIGRRHAAGYATTSLADLVAVCDADSERLDRAKAAYPSIQIYHEYAEMLSEAHLDVVSVCTPDHMHVDHSIAALEAGLHVLCEKPLADSVEGAARIVEAARRSSRMVMVGHDRRFVPSLRTVKAMCDSGELGTVFYVEANSLQNKLGQFSAAPWYFTRQALLGTGAHCVDLMRWIGGEVLEAFAYSNHLTFPEFPRDDNIVVLYRLASGCIGKVTMAYGAIRPPRGCPTELMVYGSKGSVEDDRVYVPATNASKSWQPLKPRFPDQESHSAEIQHFCECLLEGRRPLTDAVEGARTVAACVAGIESAATGRPVVPVRFED